ncbi:MAG: hypothetical protein JWP87_6045 [Labilithrix sp.]|jgi:hypothetical protein|nr:hypothetical protein [Labilithrix sp.]
MASGKDMRVVRLAAVPSSELATISRTALDRPLAHSAELVIAVPSDEAIVLGAYQRLSELGTAVDAEALVTRRGSGGGEVKVGPGTVWMQLALANPSALVACEPDRLLNRYVRPLLRALAKVGAVAHYFDRDWVSASKMPVASVAFAHDAGTGRSLVEAFVAVDTPFAVRARRSFLSKPPRTLRSVGIDAEVDVGRVADAVIDAYATAYGIGELALDTASEMTRALSREIPGAALEDPRGDPPWAATRDEAIGVIAAGPDREGRMRIGGELMASRDIVARLEDEIASVEVEADRSSERLDFAVDLLAGRGVATLGVRSLRSLRDLIGEALGRGSTPTI